MRSRMKFKKYYILVLVLFQAVSVGAQSPNVNQFLNSQLISTFSAEYEELDKELQLLRTDKFLNNKYKRGLQQNISQDQVRKVNIMQVFLLLAPVSDIPEFVQKSKHNGEMAVNAILQLPVSISSKLVTLKMQDPHPTSFDTGNIGQISPGSWIRVNEQFSFIFDLPLYFYSINYNKSGADRIRDRVSITEKSIIRGEVLPLIYSLKIGMGIKF